MQCPMKTSAGNETLIAYGARALTPEAETEFVRHFSGCDSCRSVAEALRRRDHRDLNPIPVIANRTIAPNGRPRSTSRPFHSEMVSRS